MYEYEYVRGVPLTHPLSDTVLIMIYFSYMVPIYILLSHFLYEHGGWAWLLVAQTNDIYLAAVVFDYLGACCPPVLLRLMLTENLALLLTEVAEADVDEEPFISRLGL